MSKMFGFCWARRSIALSYSLSRSPDPARFRAHSASGSPGPKLQLASWNGSPPAATGGLGLGRAIVVGGVEDEGAESPHEEWSRAAAATPTAAMRARGN